MSNLGWYQTMTTASKKVGGPLNLAGIILAIGTGLGCCLTTGVNAIRKKVVKQLDEKKKQEIAATVYTVITEARSNEGVVFNVNDKFKVLEIDGKAALIEKLEDSNNPYFVSTEFLTSISDFK